MHVPAAACTKADPECTISSGSGMNCIKSRRICRVRRIRMPGSGRLRVSFHPSTHFWTNSGKCENVMCCTSGPPLLLNRFLSAADFFIFFICNRADGFNDKPFTVCILTDSDLSLHKSMLRTDGDGVEITTGSFITSSRFLNDLDINLR